MNKVKVMMWMTMMTAFFHVLSWNFGKREISKVRIYPRENDHVKRTELLLIDDGPGNAAEHQVLVPARRFVKYYSKPGGYIMASFFKQPEMRENHN